MMPESLRLRQTRLLCSASLLRWGAGMAFGDGSSLHTAQRQADPQMTTAKQRRIAGVKKFTFSTQESSGGPIGSVAAATHIVSTEERLSKAMAKMWTRVLDIFRKWSARARATADARTPRLPRRPMQATQCCVSPHTNTALPAPQGHQQ